MMSATPIQAGSSDTSSAPKRIPCRWRFALAVSLGLMCIAFTVGATLSSALTAGTGHVILSTVLPHEKYVEYCVEKNYGVPDKVRQPLVESLSGLKIKQFVDAKHLRFMPYSGDAFPCGDWVPQYESSEDTATLQQLRSQINAAHTVFWIGAVLSVICLFGMGRTSRSDARKVE